MVSSGVTGFRLNTSHLSLPQLHSWLDRLSQFLPSRAPHLSVVLDLQGSKWRLGSFSSFKLSTGSDHRAGSRRFHQSAQYPARTTPRFLPGARYPGSAPFPTLSRDLALNDARVLLQVTSIHPQSITARVVQGGLHRPQ